MCIRDRGNIMCCSYINALSSLLGFKVEVSVPEVSRDMVGSLLSVPIIYFADHSDNLLLIEDRYFIDDQSIVSHVLFLPNLESLKRIFSAVGEQMCIRDRAGGPAGRRQRPLPACRSGGTGGRDRPDEGR